MTGSEAAESEFFRMLFQGLCLGGCLAMFVLTAIRIHRRGSAIVLLAPPPEDPEPGEAG